MLSSAKCTREREREREREDQWYYTHHSVNAQQLSDMNFHILLNLFISSTEGATLFPSRAAIESELFNAALQPTKWLLKSMHIINTSTGVAEASQWIKRANPLLRHGILKWGVRANRRQAAQRGLRARARAGGAGSGGGGAKDAPDKAVDGDIGARGDVEGLARVAGTFDRLCAAPMGERNNKKGALPLFKDYLISVI